MLKDPRIHDAHHEQDDGYWAYTNQGYCYEIEGFHTIHEDTAKEFLAQRVLIMECKCKECVKDPYPWAK